MGSGMDPGSSPGWPRGSQARRRSGAPQPRRRGLLRGRAWRQRRETRPPGRGGQRHERGM